MLGPFGGNSPQPNPLNQAAYWLAKTKFDAAVTKLTGDLPGLLAAWQIAFNRVEQTGMDTNSVMDDAWTKYETTAHALTSDALTYSNQLEGWKETWFTNTVFYGDAKPPVLPDSLNAAFAS